MNITMIRQISGTRDGVDWPAPGESIDVPDDEAANLIGLGLAEAASEAAVDGEGGPAPAPAEPPAEAEESRKGARKATNEPTP